MPNVLLVEGDPALCTLLEEVFTEEGFRVEVAHTGQQARDLLGRERGWVVWVDPGLPGMGSRKVLRALTEAPAVWDHHKVILTSAFWHFSAEVRREPPRGDGGDPLPPLRDRRGSHPGQTSGLVSQHVFRQPLAWAEVATGPGRVAAHDGNTQRCRSAGAGVCQGEHGSIRGWGHMGV